MKYGKSSLFLVTLMVLAMLGAAFVTVPMVSAYTIAVDGDPSDWLADTSGQGINTFQEYESGAYPYQKEYVWKDALDDDIGNGTYTYPWGALAGNNQTTDLLEWRVTTNATHLLMLLKMARVENPWGSTTGFSGVYFVVLIDQDHKVGSGATAIGSSSEGSVIPEKAWEYKLVLKGWNEVWNHTGTVPEVIDFDGGAYGGQTEMPQPYPGFRVMGDNDTSSIEAALPYDIIGNPGGKCWNFMIFTGLEDYGNFREVKDVRAEWDPGGGSAANSDFDAFDAAFYSTGNQAPDWLQPSFPPAVLGDYVEGEGYQEICFYNQQQAELYVGSSADPNVYDPFYANTTDYTASDTFTVYVKARNINDLLSMDFYMNFDGDSLNATKVRYGASWGEVLVDYVGVAGTIDNVGGHIDGYGAARLAPTLSGNLTLFEVDFHVEADMTKEVRLQIYCKPIVLLDSGENPIYVPMTDGWIVPPPPLPPGPPTAIINEDASSGAVGSTFHIWSDSLDASNGTHTILITREDWNITDSLGVNVFSASLGRRSEIYWTPTYADTYTVLLEVWAIDPTLPPEYQYDNETSTKLVYEVALTGIDAFTEKERLSGYTAWSVGIGPNMPADAYAPDEEAALYAYAFYNGWPEVGALVTFMVYDANGSLVLMKVAATNENGLANINFRVPRDAATGKWQTDVSVNIPIDGPTYTDTLWFEVGSIVEVQDIIPMAKMNGYWQATTSFTYPEHMGFNIILKNIAMAPRNVTIAIHIFDALGTPITVVLIEKSVNGGEYCDPYIDYIFINSIEIPKWFRPSPPDARVEADVWFDGHAVGETTATFMIFAPEVPFPDP